MTDKLLPCPFCGGKAVIKDNNGLYVKCHDCHMRTPPFMRKYENDAIDMWNKRYNPWHTGTPTEEGWYLIKYICVHEGKYKGNIWYSTLRIEIHEDGYIETSGGIGNDDVWQPVEYMRISDVWKPKETD